MKVNQLIKIKGFCTLNINFVNIKKSSYLSFRYVLNTFKTHKKNLN